MPTAPATLPAPASGFALRRGMIFSAVLHLLVAFLVLFGLPEILATPPEVEQEIPVELLRVGPTTAPPPPQQEAPRPVEKPAPPKPVETPPQPPPPQPPQEAPKPQPAPPPPPPPPTPEPPKPQPPPPPVPTPPPPPPPPPPVPEVPKPQVVVPPPQPTPPPPKPQPVEPPPPQPTPPPPKPQPPAPAVEPPTPVPPPPKKPPPTNNDLSELLRSVNQVRKADATPPPSPPAQTPPAAAPRTLASTNPLASAQVSQSDKDAIRAQVEQNWNFDVGALDAADLKVQIHVTIQPDGTVTKADIVNDPRYTSNPYYRSAAESAQRAVLMSSPLRIPPDKYDALKEMTLIFDPKDAVR